LGMMFWYGPLIICLLFSLLVLKKLAEKYQRYLS
jgi:hypothetical protein